MSNTLIRLKYSTTTGNTPSSLANGEIAINGFDGKLFYSDPSGIVKPFVADAGPSGLNKEIQFNDAGTMAGNSRFTYDKTQAKLTVGQDSANGLGSIDSYGTISITGGDLNIISLYDGGSGNLIGGNVTVSKDIELFGDIIFDESYRLSSAIKTTTNTAQTPILTFSTSGYGSGKFLVQATDGSSKQITELLVVHDGVTAYATEYAIIRTGNNLFNLEVDILSSNVRILTTSTSSNSTTYKVMSTLLSA